MVTYIKSDLVTILDHIKIAEAHSAGQPLFGTNGLIPAYNLAWGLRTVDGTYNNLIPGRENWGSSDQAFNERMTPVYRTADGTVLDMNGPAPGGLVPTAPNYNPSNNPNSIVVDSSVRTISNLIVDQTLANPAAIMLALQRSGAPGDHMTIAANIKSAYTPLIPLFKAVADAEDAAAEAQAALAANPGDVALQTALANAEAALTSAQNNLTAARGPLDALLTANGIAMDGDNVALTNVAPDEGLSAPFNSWFTLFGQFFDHGLDLVGKGGSGTVFIPLKEDDPLYDPTSPTNFMVLTRATVAPGPDGIMNTADDVRPLNTTTSFVDQNQTYTSHASHQVFVRQYALNAAGDPVSTGKLLVGANGGMATWADVKAQAATLLGIRLRDSDVGNVPLLATDEYGEFIRGPNGYPQVVMAGPPQTLVEGNPAANGGQGIDISGAVRTGHAFLADIAHNAVPTGLADGDIEVGLGNTDGSPTTGQYDNELLDAHYIAGDGRVNENIGLTAVHHVFHSEHNRLVDHTKAVVLADAAEMLASGASQAEAVAFLNEWLLVDVSTVPAANANLVWDGERLFQAAKFGTEMQYQHLVFEEFARKIQPNINVFLVPDGYDATIDPTIVAEFAHVVYRFGHSMLNESIDRFDPDFTADHITLIEGFLNPLQFANNGTSGLVDAEISAGAIIRGMTRQEGNHIDEFVTSALRNNLLGLPLDLATINLARGRDTGVPTLNAARREFYEVTNNAAELKPYESWADFAANLKNEASIINFVAAYGTHPLITGQTTIEGKRDAALTIITGVSVGGLTVPADAVDFLTATGAYAGGSLGGLENVDLWIGGLAERTMPFGGMLGSTFNFVFEVQMEALQNGDRFYYLQRLDGMHLFGEMEANSFAAMIMRNTDATHLPSDVFSAPGLILEVDPAKQFNDLNGDGTLENGDPVGSSLLTPLVIRRGANNLEYTGGDHVLLGGTEAANNLKASIGDDTLYGDGGNDRLEGGFGNDIINGGAGDDIITDIGGDDNIKAGDGNDVVHAGPGLDLVLAGRGNDFVVLGTDMGSEVFAGEGDDFILGNKNAERILGNEGSDWIETGTFDGAPGDNFDEIFARDEIEGHDVFLGDGGFDEFIGEGGDDIMVGSLGRGKMAGMSGFDWATYKDMLQGVNADLSIPIVFDEAPVLPPNAALDEFMSMEGLSGSRFDDILAGSNEDATTRLPASQGGTEGLKGSFLDADGIARIAGLADVLGPNVNFFSAGDIILGGDGNDTLRGNAGNDILDGDRWLNVRIGVFANNDGTGAEVDSANSMTELMTEMFNGTYNPGQLKIVREILTANGAGDTDTAVYTGNRADYDVTLVNGVATVVHARGTQADGTDTLRNIERLQFADGQMLLVNAAATGAPVISDLTPTEGQALTLNTASIADANGLGAFSYQWQSSADGVTWTPIAGATNATFTPTDLAGIAFGPQAGLQLRVAVSFTDGLGFLETRVSAATGPTGVDLDGLDTVDNLLGTAGNDIVDLNGGADTVQLQQGGDDIARGGDANDTFYFGAAFTAADRVEGGAGTNDAVWLDGNYNLTLGANTLAGIERIGLISATGAATFDYTIIMVDQNVAAGAVLTVVANQLEAGEDLIFQGQAETNGSFNITGGAGNDILVGGLLGDTIVGGAGTDTLWGLAGNDTLTGGVGNDTINGGGGNQDIAVFANSRFEYSYDTSGTSITVRATNGGNEGTDTISADVEILRLGSADHTIVRGTDGSQAALNGANGTDGAQAIFGFGGNDGINGGGGNDVIHGGAGDDTIRQTGATGGRDSVNGGAGMDTYELLGAAGAETFRIYSRTAALNAGMTLNSDTEIVITRNGTTNGSIIAELDNIEEIRVNSLQVTSPGGAGGGTSDGDTVQVIGNFNGTSLNFNTITIEGSNGGDTIDISGLESEHRIVFESNGGRDAIVGTLRPQDVVNMPGGNPSHSATGHGAAPGFSQVPASAFASADNWVGGHGTFHNMMALQLEAVQMI